MWITKKKLEARAKSNVSILIECQRRINNAKPNGSCTFNCPGFMVDLFECGHAKDGCTWTRTIQPEADGSMTVTMTYSRDCAILQSDEDKRIDEFLGFVAGETL
jgi:hypothetical protein